MRALDRLLQTWRIAKATPWVRDGDRLLDIGCHDRVLIDRVLDRIEGAVGMDGIIEPAQDGKVELRQGLFPQDGAFADASFDSITALAVLEHVHDPDAFAAACHRVLRPGGRVVLTVPHPFVDRIIDLLIALRLADGMDFEEHHGFDVAETGPIFERAGFQIAAKRGFQLGLNRLFVFERPATRPASASPSDSSRSRLGA